MQLEVTCVPLIYRCEQLYLPDDSTVLVGDRVALELALLGGQLDVVDGDGAVVQPYDDEVRVLRMKVQTHHS